LEEEFLHHGVVLSIPIDARLGHQHGDVSLQLVVILLQTVLHLLVVAIYTSILTAEGEGERGGEGREERGVEGRGIKSLRDLNLFGEFTELVDVFGRELIEFSDETRQEAGQVRIESER
jgi:hypothetical protein